MKQGILLVDDDLNDIELALYAFKQNNITISTDVVRDGKEALDYLFCEGKYSSRDKNRVPELILLDLHLPKINGLEVLNQIREKEKTRLIPVILLTASLSQDELEKRVDTRRVICVPKPLDIKLFQKIAEDFGIILTST
jgi:two-component system response regulator